ncbi:hypothetical protein PsYK624_064010 [Phanerochaete sordida]|uniref:Uncharacterized protein n=1 Tax=Phanerochaete sordida TaxID=48140 RepID=A0A9P3G901_9APHY|nr:hypothetical protein PsYK624_064010 [Phanerochaete sordida]
MLLRPVVGELLVKSCSSVSRRLEVTDVPRQLSRFIYGYPRKSLSPAMAHSMTLKATSHLLSRNRSGAVERIYPPTRYCQ